MTAMYTLRADAVNTNTSYDGFRSQIASFDKTTWQYDAATGLLTNKLYADGNGTSYSYTHDGRLATRTWARGLATYYSYDSLGNLTNVSYSDVSTPSISYTYGRLGNREVVTDVLGSHVLEYNDAMQLVAVSNAYGVVEYNIDTLGRSIGVSLGEDGYAVAYEYDDVGRLFAVTSSLTGTFRYQYVHDSDLIAGLSNSDFCVNYSYEPYRSLKTSVQNCFSNRVVSEYSYVYDALGRRTAVRNRGQAFALVTNAFNLYSYNERRELIGAARYLGTNIASAIYPVTNEAFNYSYDAVGNRQEATEKGLPLETYTANELNQYTLITSTFDQVTLSYDLDGNLTNDGQNVYTWNGENRLVKVEPIVLTNGSWKIENAYDYIGRRVRKRVYSRDSGDWVLDLEHQFFYDGWKMIAETQRSCISTQISYYVWGLDLSRTLHGAGGIGGLLAYVNKDVHFYAYDASGNVGQLISVNSSINAHYEYGPYGELIFSSGTGSRNHCFRFSSKYFDNEALLYYYGYRFYNPELGRWVNRDPLSEVAFKQNYSRNISVKEQLSIRDINRFGEYRFVNNNSSSDVDPHGLQVYEPVWPTDPLPDPDNLGNAICFGLAEIIDVITDNFNQDLDEALEDINLETGIDTPSEAVLHVLQTAYDFFADDVYGGMSDAERHCRVSCAMAQNAGPVSAEILGDANEYLDALGAELGMNSVCEWQDFYNNAVGRGCADQVDSGCFDDCDDCCAQSVLEE